jgi:uncharacterized protein YlaN (UPF0358 family)
MESTEHKNALQELAMRSILDEVHKIEKLIETQLVNSNIPQCPLFENILDTQLYGLSRMIEFAVHMELISKESGKKILSQLEQKMHQNLF